MSQNKKNNKKIHTSVPEKSEHSNPKSQKSDKRHDQATTKNLVELQTMSPPSPDSSGNHQSNGVGSIMVPEDLPTKSVVPHDSSNNQRSPEALHVEDEVLHISALPESFLENMLTFLDLTDVRAASLVCVEWYNATRDENAEVWRSHCIRRMTHDVLTSDLLSTCPTYKAKLRAYLHSWNPQDCSRNVYVKPNGFTIHRNPVAQSTDGARSKVGFNRGRHAWEVIWEGPLGTVAVVGVATQQAEMRAQGYIALLGKDDQSWGWNLVENVLLHNGDSQGHYPLINNAPRYQVGERIRVILDCEDNTLSFEKNFEFLGVAFRGLPKREKLFPAVSAVYGNTEISMVYLGAPLDG